MNYDDAGNSTPTNTTFDLPGGHLIFPETPIEALVREISEETQLKVKIISPFDAWS